MIVGIGIDVIEIDRIEKAVKRTSKFIERIFTESEIELFKERNFHPERIAGHFAAKEAIMKMLGTGLRDMKWKDMEILRDDLGKPYVVLYGGAKKKKEELGIVNIFISMSHSKFTAVANVIGEK